MDDFEIYIKDEKVKKQASDTELAKSLISDAKQRIEKINQLDIKSFSKIIFENVYDALRSILDAILAVDGYKSYSHEASIVYLKKYKIEDSVLKEFDDFRYKRNASKYYGKSVSAEDALDIINFYKNYSGKFIGIVKRKIK